MTAVLVTVVMTMVLSALVSVQNVVSHADYRSQSVDQVRLGEQQLIEQIRSANYLYNPATEYNSGATPAGPPCGVAVTTSCVPQPAPGVPGGFSLRVYTQLNGSYKCVQWRVWDEATYAALEFRSWDPNFPNEPATAWMTVADHIVNPTITAPFILDGSAPYGGRLIDIDLQANSSPKNSSGSSVIDAASVTGRDVEFDYDSAICSQVPTP